MFLVRLDVRQPHNSLVRWRVMTDGNRRTLRVLASARSSRGTGRDARTRRASPQREMRKRRPTSAAPSAKLSAPLHSPFFERAFEAVTREKTPVVDPSVVASRSAAHPPHGTPQALYLLSVACKLWALWWRDQSHTGMSSQDAAAARTSALPWLRALCIYLVIHQLVG